MTMAGYSAEQRRLSVFEEIDERFSKGQVSAVERYLADLRFPISMSFSGTTSMQQATKDEAKVEEYRDNGIFYDYGDGRVSKGLRGLEVLSKLCRGVNPNDLHMFGNTIYFSNPSLIKSASKDELIDIVLQNIGMFDISNKAAILSKSKVDEFRQLCYTVGYSVKSGSYRRQDHAIPLLLKSRELVAIAVRVGLLKD